MGKDTSKGREGVWGGRKRGKSLFGFTISLQGKYSTRCSCASIANASKSLQEKAMYSGPTESCVCENYCCMLTFRMRE